MNYRLLITPNQSAAVNMAMDEVVMQQIAKGDSPPTLRLYSWKPSAVSIGCFQELNEEVDTEKCKTEGVDWVRRITGGGAVFHDQEITYSFITTLDDPLIPNGIRESYKFITQGVIDGLAQLGLQAEFVPLNDIVVGGKKISGNAQTRRMGCILQHGTILLDVDVKKMFSLLKVPDEKIRDKMISAVEERVTSVKQQVGREVSFEEMKRILVEGFSSHFEKHFSEQKLSSFESSQTRDISQQRYGPSSS